jgi:hypothetical protein
MITQHENGDVLEGPENKAIGAWKWADVAVGKCELTLVISKGDFARIVAMAIDVDGYRSECVRHVRKIDELVVRITALEALLAETKQDCNRALDLAADASDIGRQGVSDAIAFAKRDAALNTKECRRARASEAALTVELTEVKFQRDNAIREQRLHKVLTHEALVKNDVLTAEIMHIESALPDEAAASNTPVADQVVRLRRRAELAERRCRQLEAHLVAVCDAIENGHTEAKLRFDAKAARAFLAGEK